MSFLPASLHPHDEARESALKNCLQILWTHLPAVLHYLPARGAAFPMLIAIK
jgi:hypothetical protein